MVASGEAVYVPRARLGTHLQLARLESKIVDNRDPQGLARLVTEYVDRAGLSSIEDPYELLEAFIALRALNAWQWVLPWLEGRDGNPNVPREPYDYEGRSWAIWIHRLGSRYGWSRKEILDLWPEEAAAYIQEILVAEYYETEDRRALSEVSYRYDKGSNTSRFIPRPKHLWMVDTGPPESVKVHPRYLPVGNVIDLTAEESD